MQALLQEILGLGGSALLVGLIAVRVSRLRRPAARLALLAGVCGVGLVPVGGVPLLGFFRGVVGDLSIPSLILLGVAVDGRTAWPASPSRTALRAVAAVAALLLYPPALGLFSFDPYGLGYGHWSLPAALLVLSGVFWFTARRAAAVVLMAATCAYGAGGLESTNLWDYLVDPLLAGVALGRGAWAAWRRASGVTS